MESPVYFASDVHLGVLDPPVEAAREQDWIAFLDSIEAGASVYLLGDVFDFWFDRGGPPPSDSLPVLRALRRLTGRAARVAFMGGNHDYWARTGRRPGTLERETGLELIGDPTAVEHHGLRLLLTHGDALGGASGRYRWVRRTLRHPWSIAGFRSLPPRLGRWIAARTSAASRGRHHEEALRRHRDALRAAAIDTLAREQWDAVVAGHVHWPELHHAPGGVYLNIGDWVDHRSYGKLADGALTLERFPAG